jgi:hypothetical protein
MVANYVSANVSIYSVGGMSTDGDIVAIGNVTGNYIIGNGSQLTGMYGDANVAAFLPTYTGNLGNVNNIGAVGNIDTLGNLTVAGDSRLGPVGNVVITGGTTGQVLSTDGTGNLSWTSNPINIVPPVYIVAPFAGNNQVFSNTILASYNSNTDMTVFYNGSLLEHTYYTLAGDELTVNIPLLVGDGIDVVRTLSANVNSIVSSGYGNSNVAAYLPLYTGNLGNLAGDVTTAANVTAAKVSVGAGNLQLVGNVISTTADLITIDPLNDGTMAGNVVIAGSLQVAGNLTYNDVVNATTNDLQWIAANNAINPSAATGGGLAVGPSGTYASFTYNAGSNVWQSSLPLLANGGVNANGALSGATTGSFSGNVTADYFIGNGSQLTGLYGNTEVSAFLTSGDDTSGFTTSGDITANNILADGGLNASGDSYYFANMSVEGTFSGAGEVHALYFTGDGANLTGLPAGYANSDVANYLASNANVVISTTGNVTTTANIAAGYFIGNGSQLTGLPAGYANSDVANYLASNANVVITTTGNITSTGNITANYFIGDGSQLTGITPLRAAYAKYTRTTNQTGVGANSVVICNVLDALAGNDISVDTTTGSITLQAGKTYRMRGTVGFCNNSSATGAMSYQWWNVTTGAWVGQGGGLVSVDGTGQGYVWQSGTAEHVFTATVNTVVQLRVVGVNNSSIILAQSGAAPISNWKIGAPFIDIEVIAGAAPYTNSNPPAFSATGSGNTVISATFTPTQVAYNTVTFDSNSWYSTSTNRYTPQQAGYYQISGGARCLISGGGNSVESSTGLRKNGTYIGISGSYGATIGTVSQLVYFNGTTDYVDVVINSSQLGNVVQNAAQAFFNGFLVRV